MTRCVHVTLSVTAGVSQQHQWPWRHKQEACLSWWLQGSPHRSPDSWDQLSWSPVRGHFLSAALWGSSWHFVTRHRDVMVKKMFLDKQKHFQHWLLITQWQRLKSFSPNSLDTASANTLQLRLRRKISDKKTKEFYENQTRVEIREHQKLNHLLRHSTDRTLGFKLSLKKNP